MGLIINYKHFEFIKDVSHEYLKKYPFKFFELSLDLIIIFLWWGLNGFWRYNMLWYVDNVVEFSVYYCCKGSAHL